MHGQNHIKFKLHSLALAVLVTRVAHPNYAVEATPTDKHPSPISNLFRYWI